MIRAPSRAPTLFVGDTTVDPRGSLFMNRFDILEYSRPIEVRGFTVRLPCVLEQLPMFTVPINDGHQSLRQKLNALSSLI
jgi:hypothetical protein